MHRGKSAGSAKLQRSSRGPRRPVITDARDGRCQGSEYHLGPSSARISLSPCSSVAQQHSSARPLPPDGQDQGKRDSMEACSEIPGATQVQELKVPRVFAAGITLHFACSIILSKPLFPELLRSCTKSLCWQIYREKCEGPWPNTCTFQDSLSINSPVLSFTVSNLTVFTSPPETNLVSYA